MAANYDREMWGNRPPWERPVWARFLRVQRGLETQEAFLKRLRQFGRPLSAPYLSELERGSKPINQDWQTVFREFLGKGPEEWDDPWAQGPEERLDMARGEAASALVEMMRAQTLATERQTAILERVLALLEGQAGSGLGRLVTALAAIEPELPETEEVEEVHPQAANGEGALPVGHRR